MSAALAPEVIKGWPKVEPELAHACTARHCSDLVPSRVCVSLWLLVCHFIDLIVLLWPTARAFVPINTDTPSDTSVDGKIHLNQHMLDTTIQGVASKLQEATKPSEASPGPSTGESVCDHVASEVQLAPSHVYPARSTRAAGRQLFRALTWHSKWLAGCSRPQV